MTIFEIPQEVYEDLVQNDQGYISQVVLDEIEELSPGDELYEISDDIKGRSKEFIKVGLPA